MRKIKSVIPAKAGIQFKMDPRLKHSGMTSVLLITLSFLFGCQTMPKQKATAESSQDVVSALSSMTEGLTNQNISKEDLKRLGQQIQKDPEAKSAVSAVNSAFGVQNSSVKYCPLDGKRYSSKLEYCPDHHAKLLFVD